jgi:hypothetical protein
MVLKFFSKSAFSRFFKIFVKFDISQEVKEIHMLTILNAMSTLDMGLMSKTPVLEHFLKQCTVKKISNIKTTILLINF